MVTKPPHSYNDTRTLATAIKFKKNDGDLRCSACLAGAFRRAHAHTLVAPSFLFHLLHHLKKKITLSLIPEICFYQYVFYLLFGLQTSLVARCAR